MEETYSPSKLILLPVEAQICLINTLGLSSVVSERASSEIYKEATLALAKTKLSKGELEGVLKELVAGKNAYIGYLDQAISILKDELPPEQ